MRPRLTICQLMVLILFIALILGLALPAIEVYRTREQHVHTGIDMSGTPTLGSWNGIQPPFWPRYLKRLMGQPWSRQPCGFHTGFEADRCEFAYPDMTMKVGNRVVINLDSDQAEVLQKILKKRASQRDPAEGKLDSEE